jgi:predicted  nucleic acid-binding Zn-ribbon protein
MSKDPFYTFLEFVAADSACYQAEQRLQSIHERQARTQERLGALHKVLIAAQSDLHILERSCSAHDLEIRALRDRLEAVRRSRDQAHTVKEFQASTQEEERLVQTIDQAEDILLATDEKRQLAALAAQQALLEYTGYQQEIAAGKAQLAADQAQVQQEYELARYAVRQLESHVPPELMHDFMIRKARVPNPAVPVVNQACSACYHAVTMHEYMRLKRHVIGSCDQCYRMLFVS